MIRQVAPGAVAVLLTMASVEAAIYKWTDEKGRVQYSQNPPPGVEATEFKPTAPPLGAGKLDEALQKRLKGFEERREARKRFKAQQAEQQAAEKIRAENCQRARVNLATLQSYGWVSLKEGDHYRALTEEERQAKIVEAQGHIEEFCKEVASSE